jgi:hypothetical protein
MPKTVLLPKTPGIALTKIRVQVLSMRSSFCFPWHPGVAGGRSLSPDAKTFGCGRGRVWAWQSYNLTVGFAADSLQKQQKVTVPDKMGLQVGDNEPRRAGAHGDPGGEAAPPDWPRRR